MHQIRTLTAGRPARAILAVLLIAVMAACSGASSAAPAQGTSSGPAAQPASEGGDGGNQGGVDLSGGAPIPSAAPSPGGNDVGAVDDARIVRTGTMDLEVSDVTKAVATARDAIRAMGGYVGASKTANDVGGPVASITYRIPSARWEDALAALRGLNGLTTKVVVEQTDAIEVTSQIVDLDARIRNLRASEEALQGIAAKAGKVSDVLEVQSQLTDVRGQIEQLMAQRTDLGDRADYGTLTTSFRTPLVAVEVAQKGWDPKTIVDSASASMVGLLQGLASAGIWLAIVGLPVLVALAILSLIAAWIIRRTGLLRHPSPPPPPAPPVGPPPGSPTDSIAVA